MGRALTPEEKAEYNAKRRETDKQIAEGLGISVEKLHALHEAARIKVMAEMEAEEKERELTRKKSY